VECGFIAENLRAKRGLELRKPLISVTAAVLLFGVLFAASAQNGRWAAPIQMDGVPNLYRVTGNIYRSGQPTSEGFKNLAELGIKTVVNLREWHRDDLSGNIFARGANKNAGLGP
jgi:hypothetical protein